jgi:hypothetical protein
MARRKTKKSLNKINKISEPDFIKLIEEGIEWFEPKWEDVKDDKGNVTGQVDVHQSNLFVGEYLLSKGISRVELQNLFTLKPFLRDKHYGKLSQVQEYKLAKMGLFKQLDSSLVKFTLSNKHGWSDKTENKNIHNIKEVDLSKLVGFKRDKKDESD